MKNPQTTFVPTFLAHIIARIDGVYTVRRNVLKDKARKKKAPHYCGWLSQFAGSLLQTKIQLEQLSTTQLVKGV